MEIRLQVNSIYQTLTKLCAALKGERDVWNNVNPLHCHTFVARFLIKNIQLSHRTVLLGIDDSVMHSIVVNNKNEVLCDSYDLNIKFERLSYDGHNYIFLFKETKHSYKKIFELSRSELNSFCGV